METRGAIDALRHAVIALLLLPHGLAVATEAPQPPGSPQQATTADDELDEVLISGERIRPVRDPQKVVNWLKLLTGQFRYSGTVQLRIDNTRMDPLPVRGSADCTAVGRAPGVHCLINVTWPEIRVAQGEQIPEGVSTLVPAMVQYGLDPDHVGIHFLQVDNQGRADYGQGYLVNDVLTTTTPCTDVVGNCRRITRIRAYPDGRTIDMQVDVEQDFQKRASFVFQLRRVGAIPRGVLPGRKP